MSIADWLVFCLVCTADLRTEFALRSASKMLCPSYITTWASDSSWPFVMKPIFFRLQFDLGALSAIERRGLYCQWRIQWIFRCNRKFNIFMINAKLKSVALNRLIRNKSHGQTRKSKLLQSIVWNIGCGVGPMTGHVWVCVFGCAVLRGDQKLGKQSNGQFSLTKALICGKTAFGGD